MAYPGKPKYTPISASDPDSPSDPNPTVYAPTTTKPPRLSLLLQTTTLLICTAILSLSLLPHPSPPSPRTQQASIPLGMTRINPSSPPALQPCGTTATTALASGCIFNLLTMAWLPPACLDRDLSAEFHEAVGAEPFYYDEAATRRIPDHGALAELPLGVKSWTTRRYHVFHCAYGWRMVHRVLERGGRLESGLAGYHHTEHCTDTLMNTSVPLEAVITRVEIDFPDC
ncbi:MAG: hypothetical protein Q9195_005735 [Heterodermia aff. obscurata]